MHIAEFQHWVEKTDRDTQMDLDAEAQRFAERTSSWSPCTVERHRRKLIAGLETLGKELMAAKRELNLD